MTGPSPWWIAAECELRVSMSCWSIGCTDPECGYSFIAIVNTRLVPLARNASGLLEMKCACGSIMAATAITTLLDGNPSRHFIIMEALRRTKASLRAWQPLVQRAILSNG